MKAGAQMRSRSLRLPWVIVAALLLGCTAEAAPDTAATRDDDIQGGRTDALDAPVGLLLFANGAICTGTLIAPTVVLTAGHCLTATVSSFSVGRGAPLPQPGVAPGMRTVRAIAALPHPDYRGAYQADGPPGVDLALIRLETPMDGIPMVPVSATAPPPVGSSCFAIGFGRHNENGIITFGEKRIAAVKIATLAETSLQVTPIDGIADGGDSGGPLACDGRIVATTSAGFVRRGAQMADWVGYTRTDPFVPWIASVVAAWQ